MAAVVSEFPEWDPERLQSHWVQWEEGSDGQWLLPLREPLSIRTPWVRLLDYSLPGYVETDLPEDWILRILAWEEGCLRASAMAPPPPAAAGVPQGRTAWKEVATSWVQPAHGERCKGRWRVPPKRPLSVFVGSSRTPHHPRDVFAPGQWVKLGVRVLGWIWDGRVAQLALVADQALFRQTWSQDALPLAHRSLNAARSALILGLEEEKILSLLNISSR